MRRRVLGIVRMLRANPPPPPPMCVRALHVLRKKISASFDFVG